MLIIAGEKDHTIPVSLSEAAYKRQQKNAGVTQYREMLGKGHSLAMDHGWQEVADVALAFVKEQAPAK